MARQIAGRCELNWDECLVLARTIDDHYAMSESEQKAIFDCVHETVPEGGVIVELGVCNGKTSALLMFATRNVKAKYHGVDNFSLEGNPALVKDRLEKIGLYPAFAGNTTLRFIAPPNPKSQYVIHVGNTQDIPWSEPIDFLIIDAGHDEANIKPDIEKWLPFVKSGGIVVFHDWDEVFDRNKCHWAIRYYGDMHTGTWEDIPSSTTGMGLKMRRKP